MRLVDRSKEQPQAEGQDKQQRKENNSGRQRLASDILQWDIADLGGQWMAKRASHGVGLFDKAMKFWWIRKDKM